jgi:hypothetical protein
MNVLQKLRQMVGEVRAPKDPMQILPSWQLVHRLLQRMPVDQAQAARICAARDVEALDAMVARLEHPSPPVGTAPAQSGASAEPIPEISKELIDQALRAFRKRLKVMRLADESKLGGRQLSSGRVSEIDAIQPPSEFPAEVWRTLAREGRLKDTGQGFYALP